ncbi:hypothetical protein BKG83_00785 [Mycobacteroides chelonae]|jgi:hypothetical protein|uniref:hypothetical protein n=1 Tax=Mycobacteroides chelonae TaxID=1774 RepID=UPI0008AA3F9D|nr:hypothetical protein [Mycobacteroides chelonae]MBF9522668.1 hypothetical protein [Mycobacteroides chelonae]OHU58572.1 hypothetical protein BKG83_00785 [Mycobacteroides chelonae]PKQ58954.1 hypothetical protein B5566_06435 [Mycobacterium sp. MHSD3]SKM37335.1 Uncharacterised protein [Mycobacteroides abscessus subsp. bolletii]
MGELERAIDLIRNEVDSGVAAIEAARLKAEAQFNQQHHPESADADLSQQPTIPLPPSSDLEEDDAFQFRKWR